MSLPEIYEVMRRIESCRKPEYRMYLKAIFEHDSRGIEEAGRLSATDLERHTEPYGPKGTDCWKTEIEPPDIPANQMLRIILEALSDKQKSPGDSTTT